MTLKSGNLILQSVNRLLAPGLCLLCACGAAPPLVTVPDAGPEAPPADAGVTPEPAVATALPSQLTRANVPPPLPLEVEFLGVGGFLIRRGDDAVMTPPLFTRPSLTEVTTGSPTRSDVLRIAAEFPAARVANLKALFIGHAHYDHLIDAPAAQLNAPLEPPLYGNVTMKNLLAALSPTRPPGCDAAGPRDVTLEPARVVALDDPANSKVDYRLCPAQRPAGAPLFGTWVNVPNSHVRFLALCSEHPDQFGPVHFAPGDVDDAQCELPARPDAWKEGHTLSFLIDFLDPVTGQPTMRVYYQDAPGHAPIGLVPPEVLADKRIDLALMCVGTYDKVPNEPTVSLTALDPRFALGGHWEDFFQPFSHAPPPIPFLNVQQWADRARASMVTPQRRPLIRNSAAFTGRALLPMPDDVFVVPPAD